MTLRKIGKYFTIPDASTYFDKAANSDFMTTLETPTIIKPNKHLIAYQAPNVNIDDVSYSVKGSNPYVVKNLKDLKTDFEMGKDRTEQQFYTDLIYVMHRHPKSVFLGADKVALKTSYEKFLKESLIQNDIQESNLLKELQESHPETFKNVDDFSHEKMDENLNKSDDFFENAANAPIKKRIDAILQTKRAIVSTQFSNGFKTTNFDSANIELFDILSSGRSKSQSYSLFAKMFDIDAMIDDPYIFQKMVTDTAASRPQGSLPNMAQNYFRESAGLPPIIQIDDTFDLANQVVRSDSYKFDALTKEQKKLTFALSDLQDKIDNGLVDLKDLEGKASKRDYYEEKIKELKAERTRVLATAAGKAGLVVLMVSTPLIVLDKMYDKYLKDLNGKRKACELRCNPDRKLYDKYATGTPTDSVVAWNDWTRDQDTNWAAFNDILQDMDSTDPNHPTNHPYCLAESLYEFRVGSAEAACEDFCKTKCEALNPTSSFTNWIGETIIDVTEGAADLAGSAAGTAAAALVAGVKPVLESAGSGFFDALGLTELFAAIMIAVVLAIMYKVLKQKS